jgi:hypothetical protein
VAEAISSSLTKCLDKPAPSFQRRKIHASPTHSAKLIAGNPDDHFFSFCSRPESRAEQIDNIVIDLGTLQELCLNRAVQRLEMAAVAPAECPNAGYLDPTAENQALVLRC